jgi:hypothetical protein
MDDINMSRFSHSSVERLEGFPSKSFDSSSRASNTRPIRVLTTRPQFTSSGSFLECIQIGAFGHLRTVRLPAVGADKRQFHPILC